MFTHPDTLSSVPNLAWQLADRQITKLFNTYNVVHISSTQVNVYRKILLGVCSTPAFEKRDWPYMSVFSIQH